MKNIIKNNGQKFSPLRKLVIGVILLSSFAILYNYFGANGLSDVCYKLEITLSKYMMKDLAVMLSALICLPLAIFMVYAPVSGTYRVCTFNQYIPTFEDNTPGGTPVRGCDSYPNINRVLNYRESKLTSMSPDRAAEFYIGSSKIESLYTGYNNGPETQRILSYIESKLSGMSSDRGLNYLANKL